MPAQDKKDVVIDFGTLTAILETFNKMVGMPIQLDLKTINDKPYPRLIIKYSDDIDDQARLNHSLTLLPLIHSIVDDRTFELDLVDASIRGSMLNLSLLTTNDINRLNATMANHIEKTNKNINDALIKNLLSFINQLGLMTVERANQLQEQLKVVLPKPNAENINHINYSSMPGYALYMNFLFSHHKIMTTDSDQRLYLNNTLMCVQELMLAQAISTDYATYTANPQKFIEERSYLLRGIPHANTFLTNIGWHTPDGQAPQTISEIDVNQHIEKRLSHIKSLADEAHGFGYKILGGCLIALGAVLAVGGALLALAGAAVIIPSFGLSFSAMIGGALLSVAGIATIGVGIKLIKSSVNDENLLPLKPRLTAIHGFFSSQPKPKSDVSTIAPQQRPPLK